MSESTLLDMSLNVSKEFIFVCVFFGISKDWLKNQCMVIPGMFLYMSLRIISGVSRCPMVSSKNSFKSFPAISGTHSPGIFH